MSAIFRFRYVFIFFGFALVHVFYGCFHGITTMNDTDRFLSSAQLILEGTFIQQHNFWYLGYCSFLALLLKTGLYSPLIVVSIQVLVSLLATYALYFSSKNFFSSDKYALFTIALSFVFLKTYTWNFFVLTESFYISFLCFLLFFLSQYYKTKNFKWIIVSGVLAGIIFLIRPNGVLVLVSFGVLIYLEFIHYRIKNYQRYLILCGSFIIGWFLLGQMLQTFQLVENYQLGEVVFNISKLPDYKGHEQILLDVPHNLFIPSEEYATLTRALVFILQNPVYSIKLMSLKLVMYYSLYRPYFSIIHNLHNVILLVLMYLGLLLNLRQAQLPQSIKGFIVSLFLFSGILAMLTNIDWDGRFFMCLLPLILCFSSSKSTLKPFFIT